jgi:hypothetical protein
MFIQQKPDGWINKVSSKVQAYLTPELCLIEDNLKVGTLKHFNGCGGQV